ncbi:MAG: hypothetical protein LUI06_06410 [Ruminococcus sp.]|nr:hypothetical protein [Ruminococcus sp.]
MLKSDLPREIERKYLLLMPSDEAIEELKPISRDEIIQTYLLTDASGAVRRGTPSDGYRYYYTEKTDVAFGERIEIEREITANEYKDLLGQADKSRLPIEKQRICFDYLGQFFELDLYSFSDKYATLEIELDDINRTVTLPDCLNVVEDVTGDKRFSNFALSLNQNFEI